MVGRKKTSGSRLHSSKPRKLCSRRFPIKHRRQDVRKMVEGYLCHSNLDDNRVLKQVPLWCRRKNQAKNPRSWFIPKESITGKSHYHRCSPSTIFKLPEIPVFDPTLATNQMENKKMSFAEALCGSPKTNNTNNNNTNNNNTSNCQQTESNQNNINSNNTTETNTSQNTNTNQSLNGDQLDNTKKKRSSSAGRSNANKHQGEAGPSRSRNKGKAPMNYCPGDNSVPLGKTVNNEDQGKTNIPPTAEQQNNQTNPPRRASSKEKGKVKLNINTSEYLAKLAKVTKKTNALRESSLLGFIMGKNIEFTKVLWLTGSVMSLL